MISTRQLRQSFPLLVLFVVLGYSIFYAVAFIQIYRHPHAYEAASRWIFENVPPGSKILGPHWDDRLPLTLPDLDAHRFDFESPTSELGLYEPDTPRNLDILFDRIAAGDYIVFPTPRLQGSVPRIPEEYPHTTAFFQLLWAEKLGFHLVKVVKERPNLWGVFFNDDLADESFSVYDHPKVTIFKNVERLSAQEMHKRVLSPGMYEPLPSLREILLADSAVDLSHASSQSSTGWLELVKGVLAVEVLAWSTFVLLFPLTRGIPARLIAGVGASKVLGLGVFAFFLYILALVTRTPLSASAVRAAAVVFVVVALVIEARRRLSGIASVFRTKLVLSCVQKIECLFVGVAAICFLAQLFAAETSKSIWIDPEVFPFFSRNEGFPPQDPRLAGQQLSYHYRISYFLPLIFGVLFKLLGTATSVEYRVSVAIISAILASIFYTNLVCVLRKWATVFLLVFLLAIGSAVLWSRLNGGGCLQGSCLSQKVSPQSVEAMSVTSWLNESINGTPTVIADRASSSVALAAGLPVFLGREVDVGTFYSELLSQEITQRRSAIQEVFGSTDAEEAFKILQRYGVDLVLIGPTERSLFSPESLTKFEHHEDYFSKLYTSGEWRVFATAFSPHFVLPGASMLSEVHR